MRPSPVALLCSLAVTGLGAQSLKEGLALIPADAVRVEVYRNASTLDARVAATVGRKVPPPKTGIVDIYENLELGPEARSPGPVLRGEFPGKTPKDTRPAFWVPVKDFKAFSRKVAAVPVEGLLKAKRKAGDYYLVRQGPFVLVAQDRALLKDIRAAKAFLGAELESLLPWLESHDLAVVATAATTRTGLKDLRAGLDKGQDAGTLALKTFLLPLVDKVDASVHHAALGVDFPADGSIRASARAFFTPASPLADLGASLVPPQGHPLDGLDPAGMVLGMGGPMGQAITALAQPPVAPGQDPAQAARTAELQGELARNVRGQAFTLGVPATGAPLLGAVQWLVRVDDAGRYFQSVWDLRDAQGTALAAAGMKATVTRDVLPGVPSFSTVMTFEGKTPLPAGQIKMFLALLLGSPDRITYSAGRVDDHTVLGVLGDADALKAALARPVSAFGQDPGVATVDALLPSQAPWRMFLNLQNARALAQGVMESFQGPGKKPLPAVAAVPPVGLAVRLDAQGIELAGAVAPDTLDAIMVFAEQAKPAPKPAAATPVTSKRGTAKKP